MFHGSHIDKQALWFFNAETRFMGLSNSRKLVASIFKTTFSKRGPK